LQAKKLSDVWPFVIGGIVPDDMDEAFVGVARLDLGEKLRDAVERQKRPPSPVLNSASCAKSSR
jgi:hypothetical protein